MIDSAALTLDRLYSGQYPAPNMLIRRHTSFPNTVPVSARPHPHVDRLVWYGSRVEGSPFTQTVSFYLQAAGDGVWIVQTSTQWLNLLPLCESEHKHFRSLLGLRWLPVFDMTESQQQQWKNLLLLLLFFFLFFLKKTLWITNQIYTNIRSWEAGRFRACAEHVGQQRPVGQLRERAQIWGERNHVNMKRLFVSSFHWEKMLPSESTWCLVCI